jgi:hypothetical protein
MINEHNLKSYTVRQLKIIDIEENKICPETTNEVPSTVT